MAKFTDLAEFCRGETRQTFSLRFHEIEKIIGAKLPKSAEAPQYWANTTDAVGPVRSAMKDSPYDTFLAGSKVEFRRRY